MSDEKQTSETTSAPKDYDPGTNWTLEWSDEFDGDTIDTDNWSHQIEKPGRFNEEWQSYTNSSENA